LAVKPTGRVFYYALKDLFEAISGNGTSPIDPEIVASIEEFIEVKDIEIRTK